MPAASRLDALGLDEVANVAAACQLCRLSRTRTNVVFGQGRPDADVMVVSEGPGYHEDRAGEAFVGAAGELLDSLLAEIRLERADVYLTSVVKCRTPRSRTPFPDEIEQCEGYLFRQLMLVRPRVVVTLGNAAIRLLTGRPLRLSEVHGRPLPVVVNGHPITVFPVYHPAAVVQVPSLAEGLRADVRRLPALVRGALDADALTEFAASAQVLGGPARGANMPAADTAVDVTDTLTDTEAEPARDPGQLTLPMA
jgi:DNA polymerase